MAFNGNFMCTSFKKELLSATHNFTTSGGDAFQIALYTNSATFTAATTTAPFGGGNNEVSTSGTYTSGGPSGSTSTNTLTASSSMPTVLGQQRLQILQTRHLPLRR